MQPARAIVRLGEPASMRDLADRLSCDRSYIAGLADELEAATSRRSDLRSNTVAQACYSAYYSDPLGGSSSH